MCESCQKAKSQKDARNKRWNEAKKNFTRRANKVLNVFIVAGISAVITGYIVGNNEQPVQAEATCTEVQKDERTSQEGITIGYIQEIAVKC